MAPTLIRGSQIRDLSIEVAKLGASVIGGDGKLLASLLPASITGAMVYQGTFDASAAAVPAVAAVENTGHYYIVTVAGNGYGLGDWVVSNGTTWDKIDNSEATETAATTSFDGTASGLVATTVQAAIEEVKAKTSGASYVRETPTGTVDGVNADFALSQAAFAGTVQVYLNGLLQEPTDDYTLSGQTVTMLAAPLAGDKVRVIYIKA